MLEIDDPPETPEERVEEIIDGTRVDFLSGVISCGVLILIVIVWGIVASLMN